MAYGTVAHETIEEIKVFFGQRSNTESIDEVEEEFRFETRIPKKQLKVAHE